MFGPNVGLKFQRRTTQLLFLDRHNEAPTRKVQVRVSPPVKGLEQWRIHGEAAWAVSQWSDKIDLFHQFSAKYIIN